MVGPELSRRAVLTAVVATAVCGGTGRPTSTPDLRVAKGMYTRPYDSLRVSTIGDGQEVLASPAYTRQFEHRWTSKTLSTKLVSAGLKGTTVQIGKEHVRLSVPPPGSSVAGLILSDPCFTSKGGFHCPDGQLFQILGRLVELLNTLLSSDEFHFWAVLGDNFYDTLGDASSDFFGQLSLAARSKPLMTVVGNHDLWLSGAPPGTPHDQLGYGFVQFYGQDTAAAADSEAPPYNLRSNPDALELPPAENFIFGTQLGDLAFFGYSAAHGWAETRPHAVAFCAFAGREASVHAIVLLGHWDSCNLGCLPEMDTPSVYRKMTALDGCNTKQMLYFTGHQHCNRVIEGISGPFDAYGFMVGGIGMLGVGCQKQFGLTVLQSDPLAPKGPNVRVDHFPIMEGPLPPNRTDITFDCFDGLARCLNTSGYNGCRAEYGVSFRAVSMDSYVSPPEGGFASKCRPGTMTTLPSVARSTSSAMREMSRPPIVTTTTSSTSFRSSSTSSSSITKTTSTLSRTSLTTSTASTSAATTSAPGVQSTLAARASALTTTTIQSTRAAETTGSSTSMNEDAIRESMLEGALDDTLRAKRGRMGMQRNPFRERVLQE